MVREIRWILQGGGTENWAGRQRSGHGSRRWPQKQNRTEQNTTNFNKSMSKRAGHMMRYRTLVIVACLLLALVALSCGAKVRHSYLSAEGLRGTAACGTELLCSQDSNKLTKRGEKLHKILKLMDEPTVDSKELLKTGVRFPPPARGLWRIRPLTCHQEKHGHVTEEWPAFTQDVQDLHISILGVTVCKPPPHRTGCRLHGSLTRHISRKSWRRR